MQQMSIEDAIAAGDAGMRRSAAAADRRDPEFKDKAQAAFLQLLRRSPAGQASGEDMVDAARDAGAVPPDDRAFGAVFKALSSRGAIRCVGFTVRKKGHGTAGGRIWALCQ